MLLPHVFHRTVWSKFLTARACLREAFWTGPTRSSQRTRCNSCQSDGVGAASQSGSSDPAATESFELAPMATRSSSFAHLAKPPRLDGPSQGFLQLLPVGLPR